MALKNNRHRKKPGLADVVKTLRESGRSDLADKIESITGNLCVVKQAPEPSYELGRFAYIYLNSASTCVEEQARVLISFFETLKKFKSKSKAIKDFIESAQLLPIALPHLVVLAIRVPTVLYKDTFISSITEKTSLSVYTRQPRRDAQYKTQAIQGKITEISLPK